MLALSLPKSQPVPYLTFVPAVPQFQHAAFVYRKLGKMEEASRAFEDALNFSQAVEVLVNVNMFDKAIDVVERYHMTVQVRTSAELYVPIWKREML